jgi:hypothetical protein
MVFPLLSFLVVREITFSSLFRGVLTYLPVRSGSAQSLALQGSRGKVRTVLEAFFLCGTATTRPGQPGVRTRRMLAIAGTLLAAQKSTIFQGGE